MSSLDYALTNLSFDGTAPHPSSDAAPESKRRNYGCKSLLLASSFNLGLVGLYYSNCALTQLVYYPRMSYQGGDDLA